MPDRRPAQDHHLADRLLAALASGPKLAADLRCKAEAAGHSWRGTQRAAERLNVDRPKVGMSDGCVAESPTPAAEDDSLNGTFGGRPTMPVVQAVKCLAAYGYEVPDDGLMHGVPARE
jgi:hypothetical protein